MSLSFSRSNPVQVVHCASGCVLTIYAISMGYHFGLMKHILPTRLYRSIEKNVEKVKSKTEPMVSSPNRLKLLRRHLLHAYSYTCAGVAVLSMGVLSFIVYPKIPLICFIGSSLTTGFMLAAIPKKVVSSPTRLFLYLSCWFSAGYALGPLGWVAQDTLATYFLVTSSALIGVTNALFLTRGVVSYLFSAELFSFALSIFAATSRKSTATLFGMFKSHPGVQCILHSDVQLIFGMQLAANMMIQLCHTLPRIRQYVLSKDSDELLEENADPLADAHTLCAGWMYVGYRLVRGAFYQALNYLKGQESERSSALFMREEGSKCLNIISSISSGVILGAAYVRFITRLQKQGNIESSMNSMRQIFQGLSPHCCTSRRI